MGNNLAVTLAIGGLGLTGILGIIWQVRANKARRLKAALDAYAAQEIARMKAATDLFADREIARELFWRKRIKARARHIGTAAVKSRPREGFTPKPRSLAAADGRNR
jgi:hypothetical protein